jgi:hypothetical protein
MTSWITGSTSHIGIALERISKKNQVKETPSSLTIKSSPNSFENSLTHPQHFSDPCMFVWHGCGEGRGGGKGFGESGAFASGGIV